jgi:hypothetical protein
LDSENLPVTANPFAAPEESNGIGLDCRSDLYSFGCLLYVMALGTDKLGPIDELRERRPDLPTSFADLVEALVAGSPDERPEDAGAVLAWMEDVRKASNIEELIRAGESQQVEFKASLRYSYDGLGGMQAEVDAGKLSEADAKKRVRRNLEVEVTKTVAAFLNSDGGMLLIGVDDYGKILGIEADFPYLRRGNTDAWLLELQTTISKDLGADAFRAIRVSLVPHGDIHVAVVSCPRRAVETWHGRQGEEVLYLRVGNATRILTGPHLSTYIREHSSKRRRRPPSPQHPR